MKHSLPIILIFWLAGCQPEESKPENNRSWMNLHLGNTFTYDVREVQYTLGDSVVSTYQLKLEVIDSIRTQDATDVFVLKRTKVTSEIETTLETWSVRINNREVVRQEESIPYVVLRFPIGTGNKWNGNFYNNQLNATTGLPEDDYEITAVGIPVTGTTQTFEPGLEVTQENNGEFIIYNDKRMEAYAKGVGLVRAEYNQVYFCTDDACLGLQQIESGRRYLQTLTSYARN